MGDIATQGAFGPVSVSENPNKDLYDVNEIDFTNHHKSPIFSSGFFIPISTWFSQHPSYMYVFFYFLTSLSSFDI